MHKTSLFLLAVALIVPIDLLDAQGPPEKPPEQKSLAIYFIDTEGGQATLFVSPSGQSMLVDTGFAGNQGMPPPPSGPGATAPGAPETTRDADRISAVLRQANVTVLDYVVITHYHGDHAGNAAELASRIPIAGLDVRVVSSAGELIPNPIDGAPGAGAVNPLCRDAKLKDQDPTPENFESVGIVVRYGNFRLLDLGDLTWNQEHELVCPSNLIGTFDVFHTTRHGDPHAGAPQLVHAIRARAAVMNNGERKGGDPEYWQVVHDAPGLQDFWQLHRSAAGGADHNSPKQFLANLNEMDHGHYLKMSVRPDGSFTMTNERNGFTKNYPAPSKNTYSSAKR